ncbi:hypothetical protein AVEN_66816-1 [Araneus ventricosus]|uniref:Uncharacterized protein n=1 Tax=Araneus ventricosus TaxID=182803 RepID=A0A4Y2DR15_ARAVE|nr:hypothetical protein AVEN_66816-1 [Araneus ventricosus]
MGRPGHLWTVTLPVNTIPFSPAPPNKLIFLRARNIHCAWAARTDAPYKTLPPDGFKAPAKDSHVLFKRKIKIRKSEKRNIYAPP